MAKISRGRWSFGYVEAPGLVCQHPDECQEAATLCESWQTAHMSAPAFLYLCTRHFALLHGGPMDRELGERRA